MGTLANLSIHPDAAATTLSLTVHVEDMWGNVYSAPLGHDLTDPLTYSEEKAGVVLATLYRHVRMVPTVTADATKVLNAFFGIHIWTTLRADSPVLELDVNLHNAYCDPNGTFVAPESGKVVNSSTLAQLYFKRVWVDVPLGWGRVTSWPEPLDGGITGTTWELFGVEPGGPLPPKVGGTDPAGVAHTLPVFGERQLRFALYPAGFAQSAQDIVGRRGLAMCRPAVDAGGGPTWSWSNPVTAGYDVQQYVAPDPSTVPALTQTWETTVYQEFATKLASGAAITTMGSLATLTDVNAVRMGIQHPAGNPNAGATGGGGIFHTNGYELVGAQGPEGILAAQMVDRCYNDRHPSGVYRPDGQPLYVEDLETSTGPKWGTDYGNETKANRLNRYELVNTKGYTASKPSDIDIGLGFTYAMAGPAGQYHSIPAGTKPGYYSLLNTDILDPEATTGNQNQLEIERVSGRPQYNKGNATPNAFYSTLDWAHIVRRTWVRRPLMYLLNDPMSKHKARAEAAHTRLSWADRATPGHADQSKLTSLAAPYETFPASHNQGAEIGRAEGWAANTVATALYVTDPADPQRQLFAAWGDRFIQLLGIIQMPNGVFQRKWSNKVGNWTITNYGVYAAQGIEHGILLNGVLSLTRAGITSPPAGAALLTLAVKMMWEYLWLFNDSSGLLIANQGGVEDINHFPGGAIGSDFPVMPLQPVGNGATLAQPAFTSQVSAPPPVSTAGIWGWGYPPTAGSPGLATEFALPHPIYSVNAFEDNPGANSAKGLEVVFYVDTPGAPEPSFFGQHNFKRYLRINYPASPAAWLAPAVGRSLQYISLVSAPGTNPETGIAGTQFTLRLRDAFFGGMAPYAPVTGWSAGATPDRYTLGYAPLALYHGFTANTGAGADLSQWPWPPSQWQDPYPGKDKPLPINLGTPKAYTPPILGATIGAGYKATAKFGKNIYGYGSVENGDAPFVADNFQLMLVIAETARRYQTGPDHQGSLRMVRALIRSDANDYTTGVQALLESMSQGSTNNLAYALQKNAGALLGWMQSDPQAFVGL